MTLTDDQVRKARRRYAEGAVTQRDLARELGVSLFTMKQILTGRLRKDAGGPLHKPKTGRLLTNRQVEALRKQYARGKIQQVEIARKLGLDIASISRMLRGLTYADAGGPIAETGAAPPSTRKLTPEQIEELLTSPENHSQAARRMGVSRQAVQQLRERWGWAARWG